MSKSNVQTIKLKPRIMSIDVGYRNVSWSNSNVSGVIDVSLTRNHHGYCGEEEDPGLARLLSGGKNGPDEPDAKSIGSEETVDLTTTAIEVPDASRMTRANPPVIAPENVQIIDEGDDAENEEGCVD